MGGIRIELMTSTTSRWHSPAELTAQSSKRINQRGGKCLVVLLKEKVN